MQIQVHCQGLNHSRWMDEFISKKVEKLSWYLNPGSKIQVFLKTERDHFHTTLSIHKTNHDFAFSSSGETVYESVSGAIEKATRVLSENKRRFKDRMRNRNSKLNGLAA
jgi:ribosomal subunit interface protein